MQLWFSYKTLHFLLESSTCWKLDVAHKVKIFEPIWLSFLLYNAYSVDSIITKPNPVQYKTCFWVSHQFKWTDERNYSKQLTTVGWMNERQKSNKKTDWNLLHNVIHNVRCFCMFAEYKTFEWFFFSFRFVSFDSLQFDCVSWMSRTVFLSHFEY